jgi:hypothetical protein
VIVSLLSLWLILFIFFAILFVEVFGMTKWNTAETRSRNYSTMGSALVMLAFMSTGYGSFGDAIFSNLQLSPSLGKAGINICTTSEYYIISFISHGSNYCSAIVYPRCTNSSSATNSESDCGSIGWAFTLFIAWNLLSMVRQLLDMKVKLLSSFSIFL